MKAPVFFRAVLLTVFVMNGLLLLASTTPTDSTSIAAEKTIRDYFRFPQILLHHPGEEKLKENKVPVVFTVGADGRVNFVTATTSDVHLKREIEKQF